MKKLLFAALVLLLLVAVGVIGVLPSLTRDADTVTATELNAVGSAETGATVTAAGLKTTKATDPAHEDHVFDNFTMVDNTYHVAACGCGQLDPRGQMPHHFDRYGYNDTEHWMECACGVKQTDIFVGVILPEAHSIDTAVWCTDGEFHWNECKCGYRANVGEHIGGTATCLHAAECEVCGETYGIEGAVHEMEVRWDDITATTHTGIYRCCGLEIEAEEHIWGEDHICDACAYECLHEGGEADCTNHAICDICEKPYGDLIPDAHKGGTATCLEAKKCDLCGEFYGDLDPENHANTETDYRVNAENAEKHDLYHVCCGATIETSDHVEMTAADCMNKAVCEHCEAEYGEKNYANHIDGCTVVWESTDTPKDTHKGAYLNCGTIVEEEAHTYENSVCTVCTYECTEHEGGTATCSKLAECEHCGAEHGSLDGDNHESTEFNYAPILNIDNSVAAQHSRTHKCCGAPAEAEDHTGGEANCVSGAICTLCEAEYTAKNEENHTESTFRYEAVEGDVDALSSVHKKIHTCCNAYTEEAHTGGEANCVSGALCKHCEAEYTVTNSENHTETTFTYEVVPGEEGALSTAHKKIHTCCEDFTVEVHTGGEANCQSGAICEYCEAVYTELNETVHTREEFDYVAILNIDNTTAQHKKLYKCCNAVAATEDHTGGEANCQSGAICEYCEAVYTAIDADVHTITDAFNYELVVGAVETGSVQHKKLYKCCDAEAAVEDHVGGTATCTELAICEICENAYGIIDPNAHLEGTPATCVAQAVCQLCAQPYGEVDTEAHNWDTENWTQDATANTHYHKCLNENCTARKDEAACEGEGANCSTKATCATCNNAYGEFDADVHVENTPATCVAQAVCQLCAQPYGEVDSEAHNWDTENWMQDATANTHYHKCLNENCTARKDEAACSGGEADCMNKAFCEECGNAYGDLSTEHVWETTLTDGGDGTHHYACTVSGCTEKHDVADHDYTHAFGKDGDNHWGVCACGAEDTSNAEEHVYDVNVNTDDTDHWTACVCGQEEAGSREAHDHQMSDETVGDSMHWTACACGHQTTPVEHVYSVLDKDAQQHWMRCVCGDIEQATAVDHTWVDGTCSVTDCGYVCLHDEDGFEYEIVPEGGHDKICYTCGVTVAHEDHDFTSGTFVSDAEYHWVACICGEKQDESAGEAHTVDSDATCTQRAVCEICGEFGDTDSENHASTDTVWEQIPGDLKQHAKLHACCQTLIEKVNHTYENGVCSDCEYACTHTGGTLTCKDQAICTACGQAYGDTAQVAHTYDNACDNSCNVCGAEREVADHVYGDWKTTKEATVTEKGSKERTCSVCGAKDVQEIAVLIDPNAGNDDAAAKKKQTTIIIIVAASAAVVIIVAICIGVAVSKKKKANSVAEIPTWIRKKNKKKKWKKR